MVRRGRFGVQLVLIAFGALALRVGYVLLFRTEPFNGDAVFYSKAATVLARGGGFVQPLTAFTAHPVPAAEHPPLYIAWLAIPSFLAGGHEFSQLVQVLWSCVLGTGTVVLIGLAGREIAGASCGLIAAGLSAVYPNVWVHDGEGLSETAALFTVALVLYLAYRVIRRPTLAGALMLGAACGLAALARPELVLTIPLILAPTVLLARAVPGRRRLAWLVSSGLTACVVFAPWVGYNLSRFKEPVYFSVNFAATISAANCAETYYGPEIGYKNYQCGYRIYRKVVKPGMDSSQGAKVIQDETFRYIRAHRSRVPVVVLARLGRIVSLYRPMTDIRFDEFTMHREPAVAWSTLISFYLIAPFAIAGVVILRRRRVPIIPLLAIGVIVLITVAVTFAQLRYRAPAEASIVLLAAVAIDALVLGVRSRPDSEHERERDPVAVS